ncbi:MAG: hypothetical protein AMS24_00440 [Chlamydiae bacterium SM23_39]|nr:MAG: hypothetical protein AMS24_00440 [Chlamydiae bacterium SM23_39]
MKKRKLFLKEIAKAFTIHPIVAILGPRQCGKTTLAKMFSNDTKNFPKENYFDLEDLNDLERLKLPQTTLSLLNGLIIIDEVQRRPDLFQTLRVLVDQPNNNKKFLILGSSSKKLLKQSSESLAGRIFYIELTPFSYEETKEMEKLWFRGGFPPSFLANSDDESSIWRKSYIKTFIEQDIPNFGFQIPSPQLRRFWMMLTHYHGNIFNASEIGNSLQLSYKTIQNYTDILINTFMIRKLQPWYENISKRQVKSPKIYFRDSGIFHLLLGATNRSSLLTNPKLGTSWEGFALEEIIRYHRADNFDCYFWATHSHAELDLIIFKNNKKLGFEFKYTDSPNLTKSMSIAMQDLKLDNLTLIYPGIKSFVLSDNIKAEGLQSYLLSNL